MKKLMIAAAIVCAAVVSQAAQWNWSILEDDNIASPGTQENLASGTAYLFASTTAASEAFMESLVDDFAAGTLSLSGYTKTDGVTEGVLDNGNITWTDTTAAGTTVDWIMAVTATVGGQDYLFIDNLSAKALDSSKKSVITFAEWDNSTADVFDAKKDGYAGAGWYTVENIPEPTSGLLLLLGMAGLALRRRRA